MTCDHGAIRRILRPGPRFRGWARRGGPLPFALVVVVCGMLAGGCAGHAAESGPADASGSADASSGTNGDDGANLDAPESGDSSSDGRMDLEGEGGSRDAGLGDSGDGETCVDIDTSSYDVSCKQNTDCIAIFSGPLCSGYNCVCPGRAAINMSGQARYESVRSSIRPGVGPLCSCPAAPGPLCLGGICTVCNGFRDDPPACHSALPDAGPDGSACVDVDLTTYDQSCKSDFECIGITAGVLCPGACTCGGAAVNASERLRYLNSVLQVGPVACPCAAGGTVACVQNRCIACGVGSHPAVGCPDGG